MFQACRYVSFEHSFRICNEYECTRVCVCAMFARERECMICNTLMIPGMLIDLLLVDWDASFCPRMLCRLSDSSITLRTCLKPVQNIKFLVQSCRFQRFGRSFPKGIVFGAGKRKTFRIAATPSIHEADRGPY